MYRKKLAHYFPKLYGNVKYSSKDLILYQQTPKQKKSVYVAITYHAGDQSRVLRFISHKSSSSNVLSYKQGIAKLLVSQHLYQLG